MKRAIKKLVFTMLLVVGIATFLKPTGAEAASSKAQTAVKAYNKFVTAKKYKKYTKTTKNISFMADESGKKKYNYMPDLNKDGVPELILFAEKKNTYYVFTYSKNKVKYVKKIAAKYKSDIPVSLLYHKSKKQLWTVEMDMAELIDMLGKLTEADAAATDQNALAQQLLQAMNIRIQESAYKVSKNGLKISKTKSSVLAIKATKNGMVVKLNGKERLRCMIYINDKTLGSLDYNDENMKFESVRIDFSVPGNKILSCRSKLDGYTAKEITDMDFDKIEEQINPEYYYGDTKISEKSAEAKLNKMTKFISSMKFVSDDKKICTLIAYPISKKGLVVS